jgi:hypothetical protein
MNQRTRIPATLRRMAERIGRQNGLIWTEHALERMWERKVDPDHVVAVIKNPASQRTAVKEGRTYEKIRGQNPTGETIYICLDETETTIISVGWSNE